jgi:biofilm PGA synthesis N-glycosyltransferase PgaC
MDIIMTCGAVIFGILFMFLMAIAVTISISFFRKKDYGRFEPQISIVIPSYNEEKNIALLLDSIRNADYPKKKIEVIVADDGSTDKTVELCNKYTKLKLNISTGKHRGKSPTLTRGCKLAAHDIILTLDADTIIEKDFLRKIVAPLSDKNVGATNGSCICLNNKGILGMAQNIEYHYNNLIRKAFSSVFNNAIWFFGAFACYKKSVLKEIGYFKSNSLAEDMDTMLAIYSKRYRIVNVHDAIVRTSVPNTFSGFYRQRMRWWAGGLMSINKHKKLLTKRPDPSILFLFINQYWWSLFAILSFPVIAYQFIYWLPKGAYEITLYTFRWFTLTGPAYVLYKIPEWGISIYNIFGVLSGIISAILIVVAIYSFRDRLNARNAAAVFLYFPYTIVLNTVIIASLIKLTFLKRRYFKD